MPALKYWDGSAWQYATVGPSSLWVAPSTPPSTSYVWVDTDDVTAAIPLVTALPGSAVDGQEVYYKPTASSATWHMRYDASWNTADGYGWIFLGGVRTEVRAADVNLAAATGWQATATPLRFTAPAKGWWEVTSVATFAKGIGLGNINCQISMSINSAAPTTACRFTIWPPSASDILVGFPGVVTGNLLAPAVNAYFEQQYYQSAAAPGAIYNRGLFVVPSRLAA